MVDFYRTILTMYREEMGEIGHITKTRFMNAYDDAAEANPLIAYALLAYFIYSKKARTAAVDLTEKQETWQLQASKVQGADGFDVAEAFTVIHFFNTFLPIAYWRARKENPDLPYAVFEQYPWYLSVLDFCMRTRKLDFPLVNSWEELFLGFIKTIPPAEDGKVYVTFNDFCFAARDGEIVKWYQKTYGITSFNLRQSYMEELRDMTPEYLAKELARHGFGWHLVRAEIERREMVAASQQGMAPQTGMVAV